MSEQSASILVYNASAGSGKTYTLVQRFLMTMLQSRHPDVIKSMLAITFTNKAVAEMKTRIVKSLASFASPEILSEPTPMFLTVSEALHLSEKELHQRAQRALNYTLHNYAFLDVETIDRFNHRLIRTFAKDLKLNHNFEVDLDTQLRLHEAVDRLIASAGNDEEITRVLVDFAFEKMDDDKSWDVTYDLQNISKLLANENHTEPLKRLHTKTTKDFLKLKKHLAVRRKEIAEELVSLAQAFETTFQDVGIGYANFSGNYVENFFKKIKAQDFKLTFTAKWQETFGEKPLYRKTEDDAIKCSFDAIMPKLSTIYIKVKELVLQLRLLTDVYKNLASLSLLQRIQKHYEEIQFEKNIVPIAVFNRKINDEIKGQPAPFIYERIGERYRHFFIDEFQDTSKLQWENLIPLIDNSLSQPSGRLLLVGDAKQSIYRWRGGVPEQFMNLYNCSNPFSNESKKVVRLEINYRSYDEVIAVNNAFFTYVASFFKSDVHRELYKIGNQQKHTDKSGGYVSLSFIDAANNEEAIPEYQLRTLDLIKTQHEKGFAYEDMCVLVRTNKQGVAIAEYLSEQGISVVSDDSLLLSNCAEVAFIIHFLTLLQNFEDRHVKAEVLYFLHNHLRVEKPIHNFISEFINLKETPFFEKLKHYGVSVKHSQFKYQPFYEVCERIVSDFSLHQKAAGFITSFLDVVYAFTTKEHGGQRAFLTYWEQKKDSFSVSSSGNRNAVTVMTIHKSKGLQFPVVIFPFAEMDIYKEQNAQIWFPLMGNDFQPFDEMLIPYKKDIANYSEEGEVLCQERESINELDTLNLVYVAMTRAVEQLFVIGNKHYENSERNISGLFCGFLKEAGRWQDGEVNYTFGSPQKVSVEKKPVADSLSIEMPFISSNREDNVRVAVTPSELWKRQQSEAIEKGNLIHLIMADIIFETDAEAAIEKAVRNGWLTKAYTKELVETINRILNHKQLKKCFTAIDTTVMNEQVIITANGEVIRPDRLQIMEKDNVILIDYKTGSPSATHASQLKIYETALQDMGYKVIEKLLVYTQNEIEVVSID